MSRGVIFGLLIACLLGLLSSSQARSLPGSLYSVPEKRRMVIRVPFMQNPDNEQLGRIFKTSFTDQKTKKLKNFLMFY
uniref:Uncharacterized protein n=1 Tax=Heterorhabditis bacteriophora TaxID=37862 RepID=A0A1I7X9U8_HETBA